MSEIARQNGWHGFESIGKKVDGGYEYICDGMPTMMGCGEALYPTRKLARVGVKRSGWLICYGREDDGSADLDVVLTFCPKCAAVVMAQEGADHE